MPNIVCTGAAMQCSMGMAPSNFAASGTQVLAGAAVGVVSDTTAANIPPFGMCQSLSNPQVASATSAAQGVLTPQPCMPMVVSPWSPGSSGVSVGGVPALDDSSQCSCGWGGSITITSAGQTSATDQ
jgi:Domain of unknown function (DUF4280)